MSDGPHRSLQLRKAWKKVAERADNTNFSLLEITEQLQKAVAQDFQKEIPVKLLANLQVEFEKRKNDLFPESYKQPFGNMITEKDGSPLRGLLIDNAEYELSVGDMRELSFEKVIKSTIHSSVLKNFRSVEEHYFRESGSEKRAINIRQRLEDAFLQISSEQIANQVIRFSQNKLLRVDKRNSLDDGVPLK